MKALKFLTLLALALVSYPIGIVYGLVVRVFEWTAMLLTADIARILIGIYSVGIKMSSVLNAVAAAWLGAWLTMPGYYLKFGEYYPVSAVIGKAHSIGQLSKVGQWVRHQLETLDPGHCERAARRHGLIWK
jgi:hypothetical protein